MTSLLGATACTSEAPADTERVALLDDLTATLDGLGGQPAEDVLAAFVAAMDATGAFEATGLSNDASAWGRFPDGRLLIVPRNRAPVPQAPAEAARVLPPVTPAGLGLPVEVQVRLLDTLGSAFDDPATDILTGMQRHGFSVVDALVGKATVEDLDEVDGDGIFFLDTHGGLGSLRDDTETYGLYTGTLITREAEETYAQDLDDGELSYMIAEVDADPVTGVTSNEPHYGVMPSFVRERMGFGAGTLVFVNACTSDTGVMKRAFQDVGATIYAGWTKTTLGVTAGPAAALTFDRLLGDGKVPPLTARPKPPMTLDEVREELATAVNPTTGVPYDTSPDNGSKLVWTVGATDLRTLVPSLRKVGVDEEAGTMTLTGEFGDEEGTVLVDPSATSAGTPVDVETWTPTTIVADLQGSEVRVAVGSLVGNMLPVEGTTWTLSGPSDAPFNVRERLTVSVDGVVAYADPLAAVEGMRGPLTFEASSAGTLRIVVETSGTFGGTSEVFLTNPSGSSFRILASVLDYIPGVGSDVALDREWRLANYVGVAVAR